MNINTFDSDFNCTTRKSTLSHSTVFLLQVMRFAKLNKYICKSANDRMVLGSLYHG